MTGYAIFHSSDDGSTGYLGTYATLRKARSAISQAERLMEEGHADPTIGEAEWGSYAAAGRPIPTAYVWGDRDGERDPANVQWLGKDGCWYVVPQVTITDIVRTQVRRRRRISRSEMRKILHAAGGAGIDLTNYYVAGSDNPVTAPGGWVSICRDLCCVSVIGDSEVRFDEPGSIHPQQHATVMFVPADLRSQDIQHMRRHADLVLLVDPPLG